jgi:hypothetical protein
MLVNDNFDKKFDYPALPMILENKLQKIISTIEFTANI